MGLEEVIKKISGMSKKELVNDLGKLINDGIISQWCIKEITRTNYQISFTPVIDEINLTINITVDSTALKELAK